jgi:hypothetical protein
MVKVRYSTADTVRYPSQGLLSVTATAHSIDACGPKRVTASLPFLLGAPIIDAVSPSAPSNAVQTLSVIGRNFTSGLLVTVANSKNKTQTYSGSMVSGPLDGIATIVVDFPAFGGSDKYTVTVTTADGTASNAFAIVVGP